jgi:aminoglycoside phosphotransferase (APT) family kinase protein
MVGSRGAVLKPIAGDATLTSWRGFRERYAERLSAEVIEAGARLAERIETFRALGRGPRSLVHHDFRPDNMMFATAAGGRPITVLDWQSVGLGAGPLDLGYFLAGALAPEVRRAHEAELLARYHEGLKSGGVAGYDAEDLRRDYAKGGLHLMMIAFVSSMRVKQTARGDDMFMQMARSAAAHIHDNDALSLLA